MSHLDEATQKLTAVRQSCCKHYLNVYEHYGYLMELLIMQLAGIRDSIDNREEEMQGNEH